jgi:hypothetical protein
MAWRHRLGPKSASGWWTKPPTSTRIRRRDTNGESGGESPRSFFVNHTEQDLDPRPWSRSTHTVIVGGGPHTHTQQDLACSGLVKVSTIPLSIPAPFPPCSFLDGHVASEKFLSSLELLKYKDESAVREPPQQESLRRRTAMSQGSCIAGECLN